MFFLKIESFLLPWVDDQTKAGERTETGLVDGFAGLEGNFKFPEICT